MGARNYDPHLGRFTQPDPSGQETNPYLYAAGDPINHTDPNGLNAVSNLLLAKDLLELGTDAQNGDGEALDRDLVGTVGRLCDGDRLHVRCGSRRRSDHRSRRRDCWRRLRPGRLLRR
ncbi:RHS repeat-associated core domain-containing protein [Streptomyces sp. NPDC087908]|uniref:RHS repeat-associated core domain-containing protein n=1 Tax=Streptomyces sp. NPDC087908 TaxID=3365820 RepID=UPI003828126D